VPPHGQSACVVTQSWVSWLATPALLRSAATPCERSCVRACEVLDHVIVRLRRERAVRARGAATCFVRRVRVPAMYVREGVAG